MIMSGESRLCYHAVPRIIKTQASATLSLIIEDVDNADIKTRTIDKDLFHDVGNPQFWEPFSRYMDDSRININIRQVLNPGDVKL